MNSNSTDDERLRSYLLGKLPEDEADTLEERLLKEDELFELSEAIEADLLAEYAQGGLAPAEREHVHRRLASSPRGLERLKLARSLNALARRDKKVLPFVRRAIPVRQPALRWAALAAGLAVAVSLAWLILQWPNTGGGTQNPPVIADDKVPAHPVQKPAQPPAPKPPVTPVPEPLKAVFQLALTSLRGAESTEKLRVPAGAGTVELQISVEEMVGLESFDLTVRNEEKGETVRELTGLKPQDLHGIRTLVVDLPADQLPAGKYEIQAQGRAPGGKPEDLSSLEVEVVREGNR
jgi:hypothetical protein